MTAVPRCAAPGCDESPEALLEVEVAGVYLPPVPVCEAHRTAVAARYAGAPRGRLKVTPW